MVKSFIVTGASRGLGFAIARYLVREGHNVVASARNKAALDSFEAESPQQVRTVAGDMADLSLAPKIVQLAQKEFGQLDGLVINHGMLEPVQRIANWTAEEWKRHFDINFFSAVALLEAALPTLRKTKGRIILTSSGAASNPYSTWGAYCASKAALKSLAQTLGAEERDVISVSVIPGVIDTEMQANLRTKHISLLDEKDQKKFIGAFKEGKLLRPEQPGHVMARLVLNAPKDLSGQEIRWNSDELVEFQDK